MKSHDPTALATLFPGKARRAVLESLFSQAGNRQTMSELARRAKLTPRSVAVEVQKLEKAGLVHVEPIGSAHVVRPVATHPAMKALAALLKALQKPHPMHPRRAVSAAAVRESLTAYGAPLPEEPTASLRLPEALLQGLELARHDATLLRTLPVVVALHARDLDWDELRDRARRMRLTPELGMLLDLTAEVAGEPALHEHASSFWDGRRRRQRYFPELKSEYEMELARRRTPPVVARWGFLMNMTEGAFRETLSKHAQV